MLAQIDIQGLLEDLKECQNKHNVSACLLCNSAKSCNKKEEFAQATQEYLNVKQIELKQCQNTKGLQSCSQCREVLECVLRDAYVNAVYLNMNKGNGGSFEF